MAYVDIYPTYRWAELHLCTSGVQMLIRKAIAEIWEVPVTDIIVMLHRCTVFVPDPVAAAAGTLPDAVVKINTSDEALKEKAAALRDRLVAEWRSFFGGEITAEIWIGFFHSWGCTIPGIGD